MLTHLESMTSSVSMAGKVLRQRCPTGCAVFPPVVEIAQLLLSVTSSTPSVLEVQDGVAVEHRRPEGGSLLQRDHPGVSVAGNEKRGRL